MNDEQLHGRVKYNDSSPMIKTTTSNSEDKILEERDYSSKIKQDAYSNQVSSPGLNTSKETTKNIISSNSSNIDDSKIIKHSSDKFFEKIYRQREHVSTGQASIMILEKEDFKEKVIQNKELGHLSKISNINSDSLINKRYSTVSENTINAIKKIRKDSIKKFMLKRSALEDTLNENENLGIDTVIKSKNFVVHTKNSAKVLFKTAQTTYSIGKDATNITKKALSKSSKIVTRSASKYLGKNATKKTATNSWKLTKKKSMAKVISESANKILKTVIGSIGKVFLTPAALKTSLIILAVVLVVGTIVTLISSITTSYASLTFTADKEDLNKSWLYITELDANIEKKFFSINKNMPEWKHIDYIHFLLMYNPKTDANQFITYLTAKYDDFKFDEVKDEIKRIHDELYSLTFTEWSEDVETCTKDREGNDLCTTKTYHHLNVNLNGVPFDDWVERYGNLSNDEKDRYISTLEIGGSTMLKDYGNPFKKDNYNWEFAVSERFGYQLEGNKVILHDGIDIAIEEGVEISSVSNGTVTTGYDDKKGNYVIVTHTTKKNDTVKFGYYHLKNISVSNGQRVKKGQKIGTLGSSGEVNGLPHLHLTYEFNGQKYNPGFYVDTGLKEPPVSPIFTPPISNENGFVWPTESTRINSNFGVRIHPITGERKAHNGVDIGKITERDPVWSMGNGRVIFTGWYGTGGNAVIVDHGNGVQSYYLHLREIHVAQGTTIQAGQQVGIMGTTGSSTGIHLHFEIRVNGVPVDPLAFFKKGDESE